LRARVRGSRYSPSPFSLEENCFLTSNPLYDAILVVDRSAMQVATDEAARRNQSPGLGWKKGTEAV
jgi:hypothetical protein